MNRLITVTRAWAPGALRAPGHCARLYSVKSKARELNKYIDRIGDENTKESQKTLKAVRMIGATSIIVVICSLMWASTLSAPVKETPVVVTDLSKDIRER